MTQDQEKQGLVTKYDNYLSIEYNREDDKYILTNIYMEKQ